MEILLKFGQLRPSIWFACVVRGALVGKHEGLRRKSGHRLLVHGRLLHYTQLFRLAIYQDLVAELN